MSFKCAPSHKPKSLKSKRDFIVGILGIILLPFPPALSNGKYSGFGFSALCKNVNIFQRVKEGKREEKKNMF